MELELFELTQSPDSAQGEMYSDTELETQKNESKRVQRPNQPRKLSEGYKNNNSGNSEVKETENYGKSDALKNFAESHFGNSKAKLIRQTELEDDDENVMNKRKLRMQIKQKHISTSSEISEPSPKEDEYGISTPLPTGPVSKGSPFERIISKQRKRTPMVMPRPKIKAKLKVSNIEAILEADQDSSETEQLEPYQKLKYLEEEYGLKSDLDNVSLVDGEPKIIEEEVAEVPFLSRKGLKKVETVKLKIEKTKIEEVELIHHEFESVPEENPSEQNGTVILGIPLDDYEEIKITESVEDMKEDKTKLRKKKKVILKNKPKKIDELAVCESQVEENEQSLAGKLDLQDTKEKTVSPRKGKLSTVKMEPLSEVEEEKPAFLKISLRKGEIVKSTIEKSKIESIHLKHHEFERNPQDSERERVSNIRLGKHLHFYEDRKLELDHPKKQRRKKKISQVTKENETFPPEIALESLPEPSLDTEVVHSCVWCLYFVLISIIVLRW